LFWLGPDEENLHAHPHLVVQDDVFNFSRVKSVIVCALTSNLSRMHEPGNVLLEPGEGGLPKPSVVVVSQVSSVEKSALGERIGAVSEARVEQVLAGMRFLHASFFRRP
jgi:mRNA interferase MazF